MLSATSNPPWSHLSPNILCVQNCILLHIEIFFDIVCLFAAALACAAIVVGSLQMILNENRHLHKMHSPAFYPTQTFGAFPALNRWSKEDVGSRAGDTLALRAPSAWFPGVRHGACSTALEAADSGGTISHGSRREASLLYSGRPAATGLSRLVIFDVISICFRIEMNFAWIGVQNNSWLSRQDEGWTLPLFYKMVRVLESHLYI